MQTPNFGKGEAIGGRRWYHSKERMWCVVCCVLYARTAGQYNANDASIDAYTCCAAAIVPDTVKAAQYIRAVQGL